MRFIGGEARDDKLHVCSFCTQHDMYLVGKVTGLEPLHEYITCQEY